MESSINANNNIMLTIIYGIIAAITGWKGLNMKDVDLALAIILKLLSIMSMSLIIAINWKAGTKVIKDVLKRIKNK